MKSFFLLVLLFLGSVLQAQEFSIEKLLKMGDEELLELFNEIDNDSLKAETVARVYLNRARSENDTIKMARGYDRLARIFHPEKNIAFADSVIELTKDMSHKTYPALGYMLKSYEYHRLDDLVLKTKNDLIAYRLAVKNDNLSQQLFVLKDLIASKSTWGDKNEALSLQRERHLLITKEGYLDKIKESIRSGALVKLDEIYLENRLSSFQNYVVCYLNLRKLDSARFYINKGIKEAKSYKGFSYNENYYSEWFLEASIEVDFYNKNFLSSIHNSSVLLNNSNGELSPSSIQNLNFFKGLSYLGLGNKEFGIKYLKMADSVFDIGKSNSLQPYQRVLFEKLMEHHKVIGDLEGEIKYLNKLLFADSIFKRNYRFFEPSIIQNFETPKLLREKEVLISELRNKNEKSRNAIWFGIGALLLLFLVMAYYFYRQLIFKKRFTGLIDEKSNENYAVLKAKPKSKPSELSVKIIDDIMNNLHRFESEKQFLSQKVSLTDLAGTFNTNPRYLSKVINLQKDKSFPHYINDLRVDYALRELTENTLFRKYTIKAIAADCGFKSAESFSKAFYKRHGIFPSYYIKKIESLKD